MIRAVPPAANETGVPLIVSAGAPAVMVWPLTTTAGFVRDAILEDVEVEEKRNGPRRNGGESVGPLPSVGVR